jgi:hypothetical protein
MTSTPATTATASAAAPTPSHQARVRRIEGPRSRAATGCVSTAEDSVSSRRASVTAAPTSRPRGASDATSFSASSIDMSSTRCNSRIARHSGPAPRSSSRSATGSGSTRALRDNADHGCGRVRNARRNTRRRSTS